MARFLKSIFSAALLTAAASTPATAATLLFEISGDYTASWVMDSNPVPDVVIGGSFILWDVPGNFPGAGSGLVDLQFWTIANGGGLTITDYWGSGGDLADLSDAQLFINVPQAPTFLPGEFALTRYGVGSYMLTISPYAAAPEPAGWALMIAGFGLAGSTLRRRNPAPARSADC